MTWEMVGIQRGTCGYGYLYTLYLIDTILLLLLTAILL